MSPFKVRFKNDKKIVTVYQIIWVDRQFKFLVFDTENQEWGLTEPTNVVPY